MNERENSKRSIPGCLRFPVKDFFSPLLSLSQRERYGREAINPRGKDSRLLSGGPLASWQDAQRATRVLAEVKCPS